jgi:hypothetical protein
MSFIKYWSLRIDHLQHGFFHLLHGLVPGWHYAEKKVETPDFDHVPAKGKFKVKGYWEHLVKNYRCFCRHRVVGRWQFMDVRFK